MAELAKHFGDCPCVGVGQSCGCPCRVGCTLCTCASNPEYQRGEQETGTVEHPAEPREAETDGFDEWLKSTKPDVHEMYWRQGTECTEEMATAIILAIEMKSAYQAGRFRRL